MLDPRLQDAQDNLARVADCFGSLAEDPKAIESLIQVPSDELDGLRETIRQAQVGLSLISSALEQIAEKRGLGPGAAHTDPGD